jgi:hypothetical protein
VSHIEPVATTTQVRSPWKATARTIFAGVIAFAAIAPAVAETLGVENLGWVAGALVILGSVTRVLALPGVEAFLRQYAPWLSAGAKVEAPEPRHAAE